MQTHLVLTVIGRDRPGLVNAVSEIVASGGGNWLDTRMANLAGQFAGMLLVAIEPAKAEALTASLKALEAQGLHVTVAHSDGSPHAAGRSLRLELVGLDRPGIVRDVSRILAEHRVNILELETGQESASFSGDAMFKARALLQPPDGLELADLKTALEGLANELMVDLHLQDA